MLYNRVKHAMLSKNDLKVARLLKKRLGSFPVIRRVIIFGSRARGEAGPDADLDLFIEVSELDDKIRRQIQWAAWEVSLDNGIVISTFIASTESLIHSPLAANPLLKSIELEGIAI